VLRKQARHLQPAGLYELLAVQECQRMPLIDITRLLHRSQCALTSEVGPPGGHQGLVTGAGGSIGENSAPDRRFSPPE